MATETIEPETVTADATAAGVLAIENSSAIYAKSVEVWVILKPIHAFAAPGVSPLIQFLLDMMKTLLPMLISCLPVATRNAAGLSAALKSPNRRQRAGLRWQLWRHMDDPRTGNLTLEDVENAFYAMGKKCTEEDASAMMAEVA